MIREFGSVEFLYLLGALRWTLGLSILAFVCGGLVGLLVALLRVAPFAPLRWLAAAYIQLFQATPLLMLLFLVFFGLALFGLSQNAFVAVTFALTCYASAYFGEIWRGSIQAVPQTQWQGSAALGFSYLEQMRHVVLPQSVRIATPPTVGFMVQLVKNTSLASIIGFHELTHAAQYVNNVTLKPILVYSVVGAMYFAVCFPLYLLSRRLEKRFNADR
ncbi:Polar amino acid ABC transporter, inner membrane subunit [Burkholderiales bacterium 8X]|nr:Polar amino acid ABC transporter, inner membrane subunit [Burkholderiales bacterium 8X]